MKRIATLFLLIVLPALLNAQTPLPSEQFVLYKVWSDDSTAFRNLGCGDCTFSARDTVVLEGSDTDTALFNLPNSRGYFTIWLIPDTANFAVGGVEHDHIIGETDSLTLTYRPGMCEEVIAGNPATELEYIKNLDWEAETAYYESLNPPLTEFLQFYINHTGASDTCAVIIEIQWQ